MVDVVDALFGALLAMPRRCPLLTIMSVVPGLPMLSGLWMQMVVRGWFKWFQRITSASNVVDKPSRDIVPDCPCGWRLREVRGVARWERSDGSGPGRPWPAL